MRESTDNDIVGCDDGNQFRQICGRKGVCRRCLRELMVGVDVEFRQLGVSFANLVS